MSLGMYIYDILCYITKLVNFIDALEHNLI